MNIYAIDLNLLKIFDAVYAERSVSLGAARLGLAQPSVSHGLTRLRTLFGDPLFVRTRRGVSPTTGADRIAESVSLALRTLQATLDEGLRFSPYEAQRVFKFHMSDLGEAVFLPPLLKRLAREAPHVRVETRQLEWTELKQSLESGHLDFAIGYLPELSGQFQEQFLFREEYVEFMRARPLPGVAGQPVVERDQTTRDDYDYVAVTSHPPTLRILKENGCIERVRLSVPHFMVLPAILAEVDLACILPKTVAQTFCAFGDFMIRPVDGPRREFDVALFWHRRMTTDPGSVWMRQMLVELYGSASGSSPNLNQ